MRQKQGVFSLFLLSPSSRRAWIEMEPRGYAIGIPAVALLAEGVDRNDGDSTELEDIARVALLAEGVDRNGSERRHCAGLSWSPSSRRAWIEIA